MASFLRPLAPLSGGSATGFTPDGYQELRRRQALADSLMKGATDPDGAGGTALGAVGQGLRGLAGAMLQRQNGADVAAFAQTSPLAASTLQPAQPIQIRNPAEAFGSFFSGLGDRIGEAFGGGQPQYPTGQPGFLTPDPDNRAAAGISSTPTVGVAWGSRDDD